MSMHREDYLTAINKFHQAATDAQANRAVFWPLLALALIGVVTVIRWFL